MALFPDVAPNYGYSFVPQFRTKRLPVTDGDYSQRRQMRAAALYRASCSWGSLTAANERALVEFFEARAGAWDTFVFFDFASRVYPVATLAASCDGSQKTWTLDYRDVDDETVYLDDVAVDSADYTVPARTGINGQSQLVFGTAPGATQKLTMKMSGKKYLPICVFGEDDLESAMINFQRHQVAQLTILQVNG